MMVTMKALSRYLGMQAAVLLGDPPFKDWAVEKSVETDTERPLIDYVFTHNGVDVVCDADDRVRSIFLYADQNRCFAEGIEEIPQSAVRRDVIARLGAPSKSGGQISDPILGVYGAWDRFARSDYTIHIEYRFGADAISKITLMRADVVP